jgi:hypothetical protein
VSHQGVTNASEPAPFNPALTGASNTSGHPGTPGPGAAGGDDGDLVAVYLTAAVRTSDGSGPGVKHVPRAEAGRLTAARIAVHGDKPPAGYLGAL